MIIKFTKKIVFLLLLFNFLYTFAFSSFSPEQIFLKHIIARKRLNNIIINNNPNKANITRNYYLNLSKLWVMLQSFCYVELKLDTPFPLDGIMNEYLTKNNPITSNDLYVFFKPLLKENKFSIRSGDIIMILPHNIGSYIRAYVADSAYSHQDIIYVNDEGYPKVISISPSMVAIVDLYDYILGVDQKNSRFAIYRYNKPINMEIFQKLLKHIEKNFNNLFFDEPFQRDTNIENIEEFLNIPRFFYCTEFIYTIYAKVLNSNNFIDNNYVSIREMCNNGGVLITTFKDTILSYAEKMETQNNQWMLDPRNFYLSNDFSPVVIYGENISIKEKFSKIKKKHD